jgi:hypothetical protein
MLDSVNELLVRKKENISREWWCTPVIPALGRLRQEEVDFSYSHLSFLILLFFHH